MGRKTTLEEHLAFCGTLTEAERGRYKFPFDSLPVTEEEKKEVLKCKDTRRKAAKKKEIRKDSEALEKEREYRRKWMAEDRKKNPEKYRGIDQAKRSKIMNDPEKRARERKRQREKYERSKELSKNASAPQKKRK